jgi:hypothetical protein
VRDDVFAIAPAIGQRHDWSAYAFAGNVVTTIDRYVAVLRRGTTTTLVAVMPVDACCRHPNENLVRFRRRDISIPPALLEP